LEAPIRNDFNLKGEVVKVRHLVISLCGAETRVLRKEIRNTRIVWKCGAGGGWEDQLERSCEKWGRITKSQGGKEYPAYNETKEG